MKSTLAFWALIFIGAALFALFTVFLSCARPVRMAAKVSPVEAKMISRRITAMARTVVTSKLSLSLAPE